MGFYKMQDPAPAVRKRCRGLVLLAEGQRAYSQPWGSRSLVTNRPTKSFENVAVTPAGLEQAPVLANLLELYAHDFSEFHDIEIGPDGRFGYQPLPLYWSAAERHPFLIHADGKLAGLVLIKRGSDVSGDPTVWDVAEFFVLRGYRKHGIGSQAAHQIWRQFQGRWEVRVMESNPDAHRFWRNAISRFTGEPIQSTGFLKGADRWQYFSFQSNGHSAGD